MSDNIPAAISSQTESKIKVKIKEKEYWEIVFAYSFASYRFFFSA